MTWSSRHQMMILGTIAIFIVVYAGFRITKYVIQNSQPSCFDKKQNGEETGIDCGGACVNACAVDVKPLRVVWERPIVTTTTTAAAVAMVENKNIGLGLRKLLYTVKLYDKSGILVNTPFTGETFLEPSTQTILFMPPVKVGSLQPVTAHFELDYASDFEKIPSAYNAARLSVSGYSFSDLETRPKLFARIVNPTSVRTNAGSALALLYDEEGNIIAASQTILPSLLPKQETEAVFTWSNIFSKTVGRVEIIPRVNPFIGY